MASAPSDHLVREPELNTPGWEENAISELSFVPTVVALFGKEVETPMTYCGGDPHWGYPRGNPDLPTGALRAQQVLLEETAVDLGIGCYHALPALVNQEELVIGVVGPEDLARLSPDKGKT